MNTKTEMDVLNRDILEMNEKIEQKKLEIKKIREEFMARTMNRPCPYCGAVGAETARFCRMCGKSVLPEKPEKEKSWFCPYCGSELDEDSVFCSDCGNRVER